MDKPSLAARLRYEFDNLLARGTRALIGLLALASALVIVVLSLVVWLARSAPGISFPRLLWMSLMRTLDAGTMGGDEGSWPFLFAMLAVTIGGIFIISALIGVLTTGLDSRLAALRKGRSQVIERGHTVILGWSEQIFTLVGELIAANANQRKACIVILSERDKVEMEDALRDRIGGTGRTRIVCRTGSPMEAPDLDMVSVRTSKAIVVLGSEDDRTDAAAIKAVLAIVSARTRREEPYHIVTEIRNPRNMEVARLVGKDEVELVLVGDLIARITAQTCRQSGLSTVYTELLDFGGDEIYFKNEPALQGRTYGEALLAYEDSAVIGLERAGLEVWLNPPADAVLGEGDRLIALSEDDDTFSLSDGAPPPIQQHHLRTAGSRPPAPERTLVLGWNWRGVAVVRELDNYVPPGSELTVMADVDPAEIAATADAAELKNQHLEIRRGDTTDRRTLESLGIERYQHVIVLCYSDTLGTQEADARTMITLLHLREMAKRCDHTFSIVSEMLDIRNRNLAEVTGADDFIVSERIVGLLMAQVAENKALNAVFADLLNKEGAEIYLKPARDYVTLDEPVTFYTVVEAARQRGESAFGYRLARGRGDASHGVVVNPHKRNAVQFEAGDMIIVLAEN